MGPALQGSPAQSKDAMTMPKPPKPLWLASKLPFFYGYVILVAATCGKVMSGPGQSPCVGTMIDDILADLKLSRSAISGLYLVATLGSALLQPQVGALLDRFGPRRAIGVVAAALGFACFFMAVCARNWWTLLFGFFLLRFFGQGSIVLVSQTAINLWWVRRRGLAMGIGGSVMSLATTGVVPAVMRVAAKRHGWRATYLGIGGVCVGVMLPLGVATYRRKPEEYGLLPDGDAPGRGAAAARADGLATMAVQRAWVCEREAARAGSLVSKLFDAVGQEYACSTRAAVCEQTESFLERQPFDDGAQALVAGDMYGIDE